jgi:uncharacterized membrane protein YadS
LAGRPRPAVGLESFGKERAAAAVVAETAVVVVAAVVNIVVVVNTVVVVYAVAALGFGRDLVVVTDVGNRATLAAAVAVDWDKVAD